MATVAPPRRPTVCPRTKPASRRRRGHCQERVTGCCCRSSLTPSPVLRFLLFYICFLLFFFFCFISSPPVAIVRAGAGKAGRERCGFSFQGGSGGVRGEEGFTQTSSPYTVRLVSERSLRTHGHTRARSHGYGRDSKEFVLGSSALARGSSDSRWHGKKIFR